MTASGHRLKRYRRCNQVGELREPDGGSLVPEEDSAVSSALKTAVAAVAVAVDIGIL